MSNNAHSEVKYSQRHFRNLQENTVYNGTRAQTSHDVADGHNVVFVLLAVGRCGEGNGDTFASLPFLDCTAKLQ